MEALVLYFNELCLFKELNEPDRDDQWAQCVEGFVQVIERILAIRAECRIAFGPGTWHADCGGNSLCERIRQGLSGSKDRYRRLLMKIKQLPKDNIELGREIRFSGHTTVGLTLADMAANEWFHGWAISLSFPNSSWLAPELATQRFTLTEKGELDGPTDCTVGHLSSLDHVLRWHIEIQDWGATVAQSSVLDMIEGHPIVMYSAPLEHEPPHVHLLESPNSHQTLAKYRIDVFERPKGPPKWDAVMKIWVSTHREQLLRSWKRCQRGGHPYVLE